MKIPKRLSFINKTLKEINKKYDFNIYNIKSWSKEDINELASELDIKIDKYIQKRIKEEYPRENIFSEETDSKLDIEKSWVLDPIDGTHNFLGGLASFGVMIVFFKDNEVHSCGILLPRFSEIWLAQKNRGVWLDGKNFQKPKSKSKPFLFGHSSLRYESSKYLKTLHSLSTKGFSIRLGGSASFDTTLLIKSKGLFFQSNPKLYDIAATACIFKELGAEVMDANMRKWALNSKEILVIYNLRKQEKDKVISLLKKLLFT